MMSILPKAKEIAFNALFKLMPLNFSWVDTHGYILGCNEELLKELDISDVIGKHMKDFVTKEVWENTESVLQSGNYAIFEEVYLNTEGDKVYFLSIKSPIKAKDGKILGVVIISLDITDRKLMEMELEESRKLAQVADIAKTEFLRNMGHDLRTPFAGIIGSAELLELKETDENKKIYLNNIKDCAQSLLSHFNEILEYVKVESGEFPLIKKEFDLYQLLEHVHQIMLPLANNKQLGFKLTIDKWPPRILVGDPARTQRILTNVITNAIKFTQKGSVNVSVYYALNPDNVGIVEFNVEDTGIGISVEDREAIFERFHRLTSSYDSEHKGNGLGLNIVKQFLDEMGGECRVISEVNKGTVFKIYIPYALPVGPQHE
jgi:two-component system, OmpR family, aerobic respiration control sensor histidine kinase ArcB